VISGGGKAAVSAGGVDNEVTVQSGGLEVLLSGAYASGTNPLEAI
jgi:autotransporter passenger strand-loop-strand repeat protein